MGLRGGMREHRKSNMTLTVMSTIGHLGIRKSHDFYANEYDRSPEFYEFSCDLSSYKRRSHISRTCYDDRSHENS